MELVNKIKLIACGFVLFLLPNYAIADYIGPSVVVEGGWGKKDIDFGLKHQDMGEDFPKVIKVNIKDNIFILDRRNHRVKIHNNNGELISIVKPKNVKIKFIWPGIMNCDSENNIYTSKYDNKLQKYNVNGKLLWEKNVSVGSIDVQNDDSVIIVGYRQKKGEKKWNRFSPTGQLLETYKERPLELGVVDTKKIKRKKYRITIKYPDKTYRFMAKRSGSRHFRDAYNNLYWVEKFLEKVNKEDIFSHRVFICNACDDNVSLFNMPQSQYEPRPPDSINYPTWTPVPIIEYGEPIVSPAGDIYCWARSKTEYKILKWTWQGEPDAPQSLKANSGKESLVLTWKKPVEDAATVTGYEIYRSSEVCGPFNKIKKVKKGVFQYTDKEVKEGATYYYQVCAERVSGYSGYSNKAASKFGVSQTTSMEITGDTYLKVEKDILAGKTIHTAKLHSFNKNELKLLRNTVFAKHGRSFKSDMLKSWFAKKSWYKVDSNYSDSALTDTDKKNITTFLNLEKKK